MEYKGKKIETMDEIFTVGLELAEKKKTDEANKFFSDYITWIASVNNKSKEDAERIAKSNFGYYAGYYDGKVSKLIQEVYNAPHPIFGEDYWETLTTEQAYEIGKNSSNKH